MCSYTIRVDPFESAYPVSARVRFVVFAGQQPVGMIVPTESGYRAAMYDGWSAKDEGLTPVNSLFNLAVAHLKKG